MPFRIPLLLLCLMAAPPSDIVGRWTTGRLSMIQYRDAYTGVYKPPTGTHFAYEFNPDGTYAFTGLMQSTLYQCTTSVFSRETGVYDVANGEVSLHPRENPYRMMYSCAPSANKVAPGKLIDRTYRYRVQDGRLALEQPGQAAQTFQRSVE